MDITFESSMSMIQSESDRKWIKELVELRHCKTEYEQLLQTNAALVSQLSAMEVKTNELEVKLKAREIELTQLKALLKRINSAESETKTTEPPTPATKYLSSSNTSEDIELAREALEKEQILRINVQSELLLCQTKLKQTENHLKRANNQRDFYSSQVEKLKLSTSQGVSHSRNTYNSTNGRVRSISDSASSIHRDIKPHQIACSPKLVQPKSPCKKKMQRPKSRVNCTPSFMQNKNIFPKDDNDDTFADSFPEENER